ncbi:MAG: adenosylmethionine--8-amino-7-oxononanoate transaminase [Nitrospirae bacterium]|nr:MAG: adenosylmethionine--8-amino-7-oxononanoate transaminase [Nitrospirota bacterium]
MKKPIWLTRQLTRWDHRYVWHPFTQMQEWEQEEPLIIERGRGPFLYDTTGKRYLDGSSSIWVNIHGHRHPVLDRALREQLRKIAHSTFLGLTHPPAVKLARALVRLAPQGLTRVFYSDNGSTAMEVALKMAVQYWRQCTPSQPRKQKFIHLGLAYHGDTVGAMSVSDIDLFQKPFHRLLFPSYRVDPPYCYRCPLGRTFPDCGLACTEPLARLLDRHHRDIAGVILEPMVQAVAGILPAPPGYVSRIRSLCSQYHVLLIADEVATGFGRTGRMFACEHEGVTPDIMAIAKGLTGGYLPLAATLTTDAIYQAFLGDYSEWKTFFHGHSYTANPLGCAVALANLDVFRRERTLVKLQPKIQFLRRRLAGLANEPLVGDIRQCGMMVGIELVHNRADKTPFALTERIGHRVALEAQKRGLLIRPIGNVLVLMPPLCVTVAHLKTMIAILEQALRAVSAQLSAPSR